MNKIITLLLFGFFSIILISLSNNYALAQESSNKMVSGIVTMVLLDEIDQLKEFKITDSDGNNHRFLVLDSTEYGLDESSGDRWISTQKESPKKSAVKLIDHQQRYAPVTVIHDGINAKSVVEREEGNLEDNLSYLFSFFLITWVIFFGYIFYLGRKQKVIESFINSEDKQ
mgnify:CR=1 FL=1